MSRKLKLTIEWRAREKYYVIMWPGGQVVVGTGKTLSKAFKDFAREWEEMRECVAEGAKADDKWSNYDIATLADMDALIPRTKIPIDDEMYSEM